MVCFYRMRSVQLNKSFVDKIESAIDDTGFTIDDFDIEYPDYGDLIRLKFKHHSDFNFKIKEVEYIEEVTTNEKNGSLLAVIGLSSNKVAEYKKITRIKFITKECPGYLKSIDSYDLSSLELITNRLKNWCENIETELLVIYSLKISKDEELNNKIESIFPNNIENPNNYFSQVELEQLQANLTSLFERIEAIKEECKLSEEKLNKLKLALDKASTTAESLPKGMWLKVNKSKISSSLKKVFSVPEVRDFALEVIKK